MSVSLQSSAASGASASPPPGGLVWADLGEEALGAIDAAADPNDKVALLTDAMGVRHYGDNPRSAILVDFYLYNLVFCDEHGFSFAKKSAFFSIMKLVFAHAFEQESPVAPVSREDSLAFFKGRVLAHSVEAPAEGRAGVFSLGDVKVMVAFVGKTFYRNFSAYRLCFTTRQPVEAAIRLLAVETPLAPPPLDQADLEGSGGDDASFGP